ncbi:MAG: alpha/beta fold hydrolase [Anaerolineaceae bacterium]|nr:alpha/beta fold hydrolase [Anaerolineaceae bacterium]
MKKPVKIILIIFFALVLLAIGGSWVLSVYIYNENFNQRFESYEPQMLRVEDFDGLERTKYEFPSDKGQMLTGYLYSHGEADPQGIIILAHGFGGGGHNSYMDVADYFARNGFLVFAYDATGNDESEGKGVGGLPQGVIDLDHAINFVETSGDFPNLPIMLFGHSWGAYSAGSVLSYHPEVSAVIACSGFNSSPDMFEAEGRREAGEGIALFMPFVKLHESIRYGKYASSSVLSGLAASEARVMIVHGTEDDFVPASIGYDRYHEKFADDPRFSFVMLDGQGHNYVYDDMTYINDFNAAFDKWLMALDYDYKAKENKDRFAADKAEYIHQNLDREQWSHKLNKELFENFISFFRDSI